MMGGGCLQCWVKKLPGTPSKRVRNELRLLNSACHGYMSQELCLSAPPCLLLALDQTIHVIIPNCIGISDPTIPVGSYYQFQWQDMTPHQHLNNFRDLSIADSWISVTSVRVSWGTYLKMPVSGSHSGPPNMEYLGGEYRNLYS